MKSSKLNIKLPILVGLAILLSTTFAFAQKTDIIILDNGNEIIGEIKNMEFALLELSTSAMSTIYIEWDNIVFVKSDKAFRIELEDGLSWFGSIETDSVTNNMVISIDSTRFFVQFMEVVKIVPIKKTFWDRVKLSADFGFNFTKSSEVGQLSFSASAIDRTRKYSREFSFSTINTAKKDSSVDQTHDLDFSFSRFWSGNWFLSGFTGAQKNTALGLDLRIYFGTSYGKDIIRTNSAFFSASAGAQGTKEWKNEIKETELEGVIALSYKQFQYHSPKIDLSSDFTLYPNFTNKGRIRYNFNTKLKWELIKDLFWSLTLYDYFDNEPSGTKGNHDYGLIFSFGWTN